MASMKKRTKVIIMSFVSIILLLAIASCFAGNYLCTIALERGDKAFLTAGDATTADTSSDSIKKELATEEFRAKYPATEMNIQSDDGLNIYAYQRIIDENSNKWVLAVHGYGGQAKNMDYVVIPYAENGYNILSVECRASGKSDGKYIGMGWLDRRDVILWIHEILKINPQAEIILYGVSMGGATVMMTAGEEDLPENIKCVVEDCGYTSAYDEFAYQLQQLFGLPTFPFMQIAQVCGSIRAGYSIKEASALEQVKKSKIPILFIHGADDTFVPTEMVYALYEAATCEKQLLIIDRAGHAEAYYADTTLYMDTVWPFVNQYITSD